MENTLLSLLFMFLSCFDLRRHATILHYVRVPLAKLPDFFAHFEPSRGDQERRKWFIPENSGRTVVSDHLSLLQKDHLKEFVWKIKPTCKKWSRTTTSVFCSLMYLRNLSSVIIFSQYLWCLSNILNFPIYSRFKKKLLDKMQRSSEIPWSIEIRWHVLFPEQFPCSVHEFYSWNRANCCRLRKYLLRHVPIC